MQAIMFPGQGSQYKGMGKDLFPKFPNETRLASQILGYSIEDLCVNDSRRELTKTQFTQPALFVVNALMYEEIKKTKKPDFLLGHSLGEYNALHAAGAFEFETGLKLVKKRGELMAEANGGGMAAVLGLPVEDLTALLKDSQYEGIDVANYNTPTQNVVSGPQHLIDAFVKNFDQKGIRAVPLFVSAPFHSRYMKPAASKFAEFLKGFRFSSMSIPVISNVTAEVYDRDNIVKLLSTQISSPVQWTQSIHALFSKKCYSYEQVNGNILTRMVEETKKEYDLNVENKIPVSVTKTVNETNEEISNSRSSLAKQLGSEAFRAEYNLKYSYAAGGLYNGIASKEMVIKLADAGMLTFLGASGVPLSEAEKDIIFIKGKTKNSKAVGINLLYNFYEPKLESALVDLVLKHEVRVIEAAGYIQVTPELVRYRLNGLREVSGSVVCDNRIVAKLSRPEVAEAFMRPAPEKIVKVLLEQNLITARMANLSVRIPMSHDICIAADSGGQTDRGVAFALLPSIQQLRKNIDQAFNYKQKIRIGLAGGIGTPQAAAGAFVMGADFIMTGSINQCTVEAGTSNEVKEMLQSINVQDTDYCPGTDLFEVGAKVQVLKKGVLFPARANKLYNLYMQYNSIEEIPSAVIEQIEKTYFGRNMLSVWTDLQASLRSSNNESEILKASEHPKHKMALLFKSYMTESMRAALKGEIANKINFQVHTGPALGAFNQWVKGTPLDQWQNRKVDEIGIKLMEETGEIFKNIKTQFNNSENHGEKSNR